MTTPKARAAEDSDSFPLAAQIPLQSFTLPPFPAQAAKLRALTLTADIKLDEYQSLVQNPDANSASIDKDTSFDLPPSITSLTLELFTLGFPAGFLRKLARGLPNLRELTLFSCLVDGIGEESRGDALGFFEIVGKRVKEMHVLDSFARAGFWDEAVTGKEGGGRGGLNLDLRVLEVSYTYRGWEDEGFLGRVGGEEWASWVTPGLVGVGFGLVPERGFETGGLEGDKKEGGGKKNDGMLPFAVNSRASQSLRKRFEGMKDGQVKGLRMLDLSLWTLRTEEVGRVVGKCCDGAGGLVDLTVSVLMEEGWWETLVKSFGTAGMNMEGLEIVGVPFELNDSKGGNGVSEDDLKVEASLLGRGDLEKIASVCPSLMRLSMTILRAKSFGMTAWVRLDSSSDWVHAN